MYVSKHKNNYILKQQHSVNNAAQALITASFSIWLYMYIVHIIYYIVYVKVLCNKNLYEYNWIHVLLSAMVLDESILSV